MALFPAALLCLQGLGAWTFHHDATLTYPALTVLDAVLLELPPLSSPLIQTPCATPLLALYLCSLLSPGRRFSLAGRLTPPPLPPLRALTTGGPGAMHI